jgi:hypothetical protein
MSNGARLGLAVAVGYILGKFHKMKWALALAALAGRGRLPSGPGGLLQQGAKLLTSSPEFTKLTGEMRGRLVDAGKAAAVGVVSSKINSLSEGLRQRGDAMRSAGGNGGAAVGDEEDVNGDEDGDGDERYRDEGRTADASRKRHPDEDDESHVPAPRHSGSSREPHGTRATGQSRDREDAARGPSRQSRDGGSQRSGGGATQRQDGGRSGPRSSASRTRG